MTEQDRTDSRLKTLQTQVDELRAGLSRQQGYAAFAGIASALAVAVVALSTGTWFVDESHRYNAWQQPDEINWFGYVAVILLVALAAVSLASTRADGYKFHWLVAWLAALTAVCVLVLGTQLPREGDLFTAPAYWFTIVAAIGLALAHGYRGDQVRRELHY